MNNNMAFLCNYINGNKHKINVYLNENCFGINNRRMYIILASFHLLRVNPFPPMSVKWHLQILLCLTPDDVTSQWGTP